MEFHTYDWLPIVNATTTFTIKAYSTAFRTAITKQRLVLFIVECIVVVHSIGKLDFVAKIASIARVTGRAASARALEPIGISFVTSGPYATLIGGYGGVIRPFKC
jgi:hypothetical protein